MVVTATRGMFRACLKSPRKESGLIVAFWFSFVGDRKLDMLFLGFCLILCLLPTHSGLCLGYYGCLVFFLRCSSLSFRVFKVFVAFPSRVVHS